MRKDEVWQNRSGGRIEPIFPNGADILHKGSDRYFNFKDVVGDLGYGFRDNAGVMEVKDNTGAWTPFSSLGVSDHSLLTNLDYASSGHTGFQPAGTYIDGPVPGNDTDIIFNDGGDLGASDYFRYDKTDSRLIIADAHSNIKIGENSLAGVVNSNGMITHGANAGLGAEDSSICTYIGAQSGQGATGNGNVTGLASYSAYGITNSTNVLCLAPNTGEGADNLYDCAFIGTSSGSASSYLVGCLGIGAAALADANNIVGAIAGGFGAGAGASYSDCINAFGENSLNSVISSMFTNSFGFNNGAFSSYSPYSNLFGAYVATNIDTLRNDIIIGTAISLPSGTKDSMSLGNVLYGAGFHSPATNYTEGSRNSLLDPSSVDPAGTGKIAIGKLVDENYKLQVKGTTGFDAIVFTGAGLNDMVKAGEPTTTDNVVHTYAITLSNASGIITSTLNAKGNAVSIYTTGNASVVNGSTTVTGVGTGWITANHVGNYFRITVANGGDDVWYKIASRTSTTQIDLAVPYGGTTVSNKTYSLNSAFTVDGGSVLAEGVVLTINAGGVGTYQMLNIGSGYSIANAITTTRTSANGMANFKINITAIEDVFTWQKDGGVSSAPIEIIGFLNPHTITDGLSIAFTQELGHTLSDMWTVTSTPLEPFSVKTLDGTEVLKTDNNGDTYLPTGGLNGLVIRDSGFGAYYRVGLVSGGLTLTAV